MRKLLLFLSLAATCTVHAQTTLQFTATVSNSWLDMLNWSINTLVPGTSAIAVFGTQPSGNGVNNGCSIDFGSLLTNNGSGNQVVGAIRVLSTRTRDMNIGNSSSQVDGTLTLSGVTVGSVSNVVVDNLMAGYDFNIKNSIVGASRTMKLALGTNAVFSGATNSRTAIVVQVSSATNVTVNGGELQLNRSGGTTFPATTNFTVSSGTLHISSDQTLNNLSLAAGTTLSVDNGVTLTVTGTFTDGGATVSASGTGKVSYNANAALSYTGTSAMTMGSEWPSTNTPTSVTVSNTGGLTLAGNRTATGAVTVNSILNAGTYQLAATSLTVNNGATIKLGSTSTSGAVTGNFGTTSVTLNTGSTVEFNGSGAQYAAAQTFSNLTVNNGSNGVALIGNVIINGALTLNSSTKLDLSGKSLTLGGTVTGAGAFKGSSASTLNVASAATVGTLSFDQTTDGTSNALASLAVSSGSATLGSKLNIYTALNIAGGTLDLAAKNLVLKSTSSQTAYVAKVLGTLTGESNVTVERYSPAWSSRRWRLITSPVLNTTINAAWQEGVKWNGSGTNTSTGYGTLITGQQQGSAAAANANGFDYWSSIANSSASVRYYSPSSSGVQANWKAVTSTLNANAFNNNEAYLVFVRGDRATYSGTAAGATTVRGTGTLKKGNYTISVPSTQGYTLIGNPYASPLDFKALYDDNSTKIQSSFYIWQSSLGTGVGGYVLVRPVSTGSSLYEAVPGDGTQSTTNRLIHSGEGFFVMPSASAGSGNSITIQESHKSTTTPAVSVFRQIVTRPAKLYVNLYTGTGSAKILLDGALSQYNDPSADGAEAVLGEGTLQKAFNSNENLSIQQDGGDWIVMSGARPQAGDTLRLRIWNTAAKDYQLEIRGTDFAALGVTPILVDQYTAQKAVINPTEAATTYAFSVNADAASKNADRFYLVFRTSGTLPLSLTSLKAEEKAKNVAVKWTVTNENDIKSYQVEKSVNATNFTALALVPARGKAGEQAYEYVDKEPSALNYYRVKLTGTSGESKYSPVVKVQLLNGAEALSLYPNPVIGDSFGLQFTNKPQGRYTVSLINMAGQIIMQKIVQHTGGSATETFTLAEEVANGNYCLEVKGVEGQGKVLGVSVQR